MKQLLAQAHYRPRTMTLNWWWNLFEQVRVVMSQTMTLLNLILFLCQLFARLTLGISES